MPLCRNRAEALEQMQRIRENNVSMAIFCTASHWNTEAIIKAADDFARDNGIDCLPLTVAMTFNYPHMQQAQRVTYSKSPELGMLSLVEFVKLLCGSEYSPYKRVMPLLHLDHASPKFDEWALYSGVEHLNSVMFDAQLFPIDENIRLTSEYVQRFGDRILVEGIMDELSVLGEMKTHDDDSYVSRAVDYVAKTGVDFLVADLGTEQQSAASAGTFLRQRALDLTAGLGKAMLVLHGTSCLSDGQICGLADCGILRVNIWTRIAREAGQFAAENIARNIDKIRTGSFEFAESNMYMRSSVEHASEIMYRTLELLQYKNLGR